MHVLDVVDPADHEQSMAVLAEVLQRRPQELELSLMHRDGHRVRLASPPSRSWWTAGSSGRTAWRRTSPTTTG